MADGPPFISDDRAFICEREGCNRWAVPGHWDHGHLCSIHEPGQRIGPPFISLMHGDGWQRCCICFEAHEAPFDGLYRDADGQLWDVCAGNCAKEAGYV